MRESNIDPFEGELVVDVARRHVSSLLERIIAPPNLIMTMRSVMKQRTRCFGGDLATDMQPRGRIVAEALALAAIDHVQTVQFLL